MVLVALKAMFRSVCLNRLVTRCIKGLWYVNVTHFLRVLKFSCCWSGGLCCLVCSFFFRLFIVLVVYPLFMAIASIVVHSDRFAASVMVKLCF